MEEALLVKKIQAGSREAFSELVSLYQNRVIHIAYSMLSDYEDAVDVSQEVFLKIYRSIGNFRGESALSTWIFRICKNTCNDFLRKKKIVTISFDKENDDEKSFDIADDGRSVEKAFEQNERKELIKKALRTLTPEHRTVLVLRDIEGLSYEEISKITGDTLGTVKSRINRAREKLKKVLEKNRELFL